MTGNIILINLILWPFASALICYLAGWKKHPYGSDGSIETKEQAKTRKDYRNMLVWSAVAIEVLLYIFAIISSEKNGYTLRIEKICGLGIGLRFGGFRTIYAGVALLMWSMTR